MLWQGPRFYWRLWLAVVGAVAALTLGALGLWALVQEEQAQVQAARAVREIVVRNQHGEVIGQAPARPVRAPGEALEFVVETVDGQRLSVQLPRPHRPPGHRPPHLPPPWWTTPGGVAALLGLVALAVALGAYPVVRRLTQRLEALQRGVQRWGEGDLSVRLPEQGQDEVAFLAQRFNAAARRVEDLLAAHKALLANASHELRSPLARLRMGLALLDEDGSATAARLEMARSIEELDRLIDEILLASRLDAARSRDPAMLGPREAVDLIGLLAEACARADAELRLAHGLDACTAMGHPRLLQRLMRNLLDNARRHAARGPDGDPQVEVGLSETHEGGCRWAVIEVDDRGPGVPPEERERIFEPFYRARGASERDGGVGLGLALVRSIATAHGGHVLCTERPGGGARFVVTLPAAEDEARPEPRQGRNPGVA